MPRSRLYRHDLMPLLRSYKLPILFYLKFRQLITWLKRSLNPWAPPSPQRWIILRKRIKTLKSWLKCSSSNQKFKKLRIKIPKNHLWIQQSSHNRFKFNSPKLIGIIKTKIIRKAVFPLNLLRIRTTIWMIPTRVHPNQIQKCKMWSQNKIIKHHIIWRPKINSWIINNLLINLVSKDNESSSENHHFSRSKLSENQLSLMNLSSVLTMALATRWAVVTQLQITKIYINSQWMVRYLQT